MSPASAGRSWLLVPAVLFLILPYGAKAIAPAIAPEELPAELTIMLREAHPRERKAIVDVAKRLHPDAVERIDEIVRQIEKDDRASAAGAGFLQGWQGEAALGGFLTTGNTDEWGVSASLSAKRKGPRWTHEAELRLDIKEESKERTEERAWGKYTLRRTLGAPRLFAFGRVSFERDRLQGIDRRFFESIGLGYQILEGRSVRWDAMAGPALRQTRYSDGISINEPALFARTKLEWEITDTLRFSEEADAGLAEDNSTFTSTTALTSNLYGRLSGRISFGVEIETNPPEGREKTDTYTKASLVYVF